jgi:hypothetical protein
MNREKGAKNIFRARGPAQAIEKARFGQGFGSGLAPFQHAQYVKRSCQ